MIKVVLQLIRFPGIFTAFSNVLIGFFLISNGNFEFSSLPYLLTTTGLLFSGGMMMNDYVDQKIDLIERPKRPLPSRKISRQKTLFLIIICFSLANISAMMIGDTAIIISLLMSGLILCYNFKLKYTKVFGIICISSIRFLNIILGFSILDITFDVIPYAIPLGVYVTGLSILAKNELKSNSRDLNLNKIFFSLTILTAGYLIIQNYSLVSIIFLCCFSIIVILSLKYYKMNIPKIISIQILGIIFLDAAIVGLKNELIYGIIISVLIIPAYIMSKKIYIT